MIFTKEQSAEFEKVTRPLIKFINDNCHPHVTVVVDCTNAELSEGICSIRTDKFIKD